MKALLISLVFLSIGCTPIKNNKGDIPKYVIYSSGYTLYAYNEPLIQDNSVRFMNGEHKDVIVYGTFVIKQY